MVKIIFMPVQVLLPNNFTEKLGFQSLLGFGIAERGLWVCMGPFVCFTGCLNTPLPVHCLRPLPLSALDVPN